MGCKVFFLKKKKEKRKKKKEKRKKKKEKGVNVFVFGKIMQIKFTVF